MSASARKKNELTSFGLEIKIGLLKAGISQREFCKLYNIPENRFSEIMHSDGYPLQHYRRIISEKLKIKI